MKLNIEKELEQIKSDSKYPESRPNGKQRLILEFDNDWPEDLVTMTADDRIVIHLDKKISEFEK